METNNFALYQGKIVYVPDVLEEPIIPERCKDIVGYGVPEWVQYARNLQSAIASGIEVENQDEVYGLLWNANSPTHGWDFELGKLYSLQCRVEVMYFLPWRGEYVSTRECIFNKSDATKTVARVTFEQPEKVYASDAGKPCKCGSYIYSDLKANHFVNCACGNPRPEPNDYYNRKGKPEAAGQEQPPILKPVAYQRETGSHLPYGRYLVIRKDGKTHLETYNGTGWAYNDNAISFYYLPKIS